MAEPTPYGLHPRTLKAFGLGPEVWRRYAESLKIFDAEFSDEDAQRRRELICPLLEQCEAARSFKWTEDSGARKRDSLGKKGRLDASKKSADLGAYLRNHSMQVSFLMADAILQTGVHLRTASDQVPLEQGVAWSPSHALRLASLLDAMAACLKDPKKSFDGPMVYSTRHGPFDFPGPVWGKKPPNPTTCLSVFLSFLFRLHSKGQVFRSGELVPKDGQPRWQLVSQLVRDALGMDIDDIDDSTIENTATRFQGNNPDIRMVGYRG